MGTLKCAIDDVELEDINKKVIHRYLDAAKHPVAANRRIQFLKAAYSWDIQLLEGMNDNPFAGHKSEKMHAVYMRKLIEIEATK